jgi:hypothetical protein
MAVAYVSERCSDCADFVRALQASPLAASVRLLTVERVESIPWYVETVPSLVVQDGAGLSVYAADDAFAALETAVVAEPERREPERREPARREPAHPLSFDDEPQFAGLDGGDEPGAIGCAGSNYEPLVGADEDAALTARTLASWERSMRSEKASAKERDVDSVEQRYESLIQQRQEPPTGRVG